MLAKKKPQLFETFREDVLACHYEDQILGACMTKIIVYLRDKLTSKAVVVVPARPSTSHNVAFCFTTVSTIAG